MNSDNSNQAYTSHRLFENKEIKKSIAEIADNINSALKNQEILVICVMKGALVFCGHLLPLLRLNVQLDYIHASRYGASVNGGKLKLISECHEPLNGKSILIVDDICDEGETLKVIKSYCVERGAKEVHTAVLINRAVRENKKFTPDFFGINLEDTKFIYGFGIDWNGCGRNLPDLYAMQDKTMEALN
jgi:hypoxanthine phosphoribosyltransferase